MIYAFLLIAMFGIDNKEFIDTSSKQLKEGYSWTQIECREATPGIPALTIDHVRDDGCCLHCDSSPSAMAKK